MSKPVYLNGIDMYEQFKARLLDYKVGPPNIKNPYLTLTNSIIPVKLKESIGTRPIALTLEFDGDTCNESLINISNLTAYLLYENEIQLPDGFYYFCIFDKVSEPTLKGGTLYTVTFNLVGYRHGALVSQEFTESGSITALGNYKAPAIITIENASGTVTVNDITVNDIENTVIINGYDKTVFETDGIYRRNKFKSCEMTEFPYLYPGVNFIQITGSAKVTIEYKPIYL